MARLMIVSNRLPITIDKKDGELFYHPSAGGLATGLNSLDQDMDKVWIGWPGKTIRDEAEKRSIEKQLHKDDIIPVFLSRKEKLLYYEGFSNKTVWPHFHYFTQYTTYDTSYWKAYKSVNQKFADAVCEHYQDGDLIWVHDYQLLLVPNLIRENCPNASIGFFLHIPFPSYEIFRILPWRKELLEGVLGADQIGFHTFGYMRHFLSAAYRITGHEHHFGKLTIDNRLINVDVFPMGIDYNKYAFPEQVTNQKEGYEAHYLEPGQKLILSIDRLDYTKGIPERIEAMAEFFERYPKYRGKVSLVMIVVPSRSNVDQYMDLKNEVDTLVGRINAQYSNFDWTPILYFYRSFPFQDLTSMYKAADVALITPLRDGMNLVAKEYIASKETTKQGVLILSEMAGASNELTEAISVNPHDIDNMVESLVRALEMPLEEQAERLEVMQYKLKRYNVKHWAESFINEQIEMMESQQVSQTNLLNSDVKTQLIQQYKTAEQRLLFLDYDGTLMNFQTDPQAVVPDKELMQLLENICADSKNKLVIITGRDRHTIDEWLGHLACDMAAEHGVWLKENNKWRKSTEIFDSWKKDIRPVLEDLVLRTPGSFIEEKDYSIAWHYRKIDKDLGEKRVREFRDVLRYLTASLDLQVLEGNKVVEIKNAGVSKGKAALNWINAKNWDFYLAVGDDHTDEDTFKALPTNDNAYTIKVGIQQTTAKYNLLTVEEVRTMLTEMVSE